MRSSQRDRRGAGADDGHDDAVEEPECRRCSRPTGPHESGQTAIYSAISRPCGCRRTARLSAVAGCLLACAALQHRTAVGASSGGGDGEHPAPAAGQRVPDEDEVSDTVHDKVGPGEPAGCLSWRSTGATAALVPAHSVGPDPSSSQKTASAGAAERPRTRARGAGERLADARSVTSARMAKRDSRTRSGAAGRPATAARASRSATAIPVSPASLRRRPGAWHERWASQPTSAPNVRRWRRRTTVRLCCAARCQLRGGVLAAAAQPARGGG